MPKACASDLHLEFAWLWCGVMGFGGGIMQLVRAYSEATSGIRWRRLVITSAAGSAAACFLLALSLCSDVAFAAPAGAPPSDPRAAQAFAILDANCSGCHQAGKLSGPAPGGDLANILSLSELVAEPHLVRPGQPDASRLYHVLLDRHRPLDLSAETPWPDRSDIQRVRTYLEQAAAPARACGQADAPITAQGIAAAIDAATTAAGETVGRDLRFITLSHFSNDCMGEWELEGYRQAIGKLLNSLSWGLRPVALKRIDPGGTILAFRLADIGWIPEHWAAIAAREPTGIALDLAGKLSSRVADNRPVRADWLAFAIRDSALYGELLGLPPTLEELVRLLGIDREGEIGTAKAPRAAIRQSQITRGPRVIERFQAENRRLWLAYDTAEASGERDVFDRPLGYIRTVAERYRFRADGLRALFTLPNGFLGYSVFDPNGVRVPAVPAAIDTPAARWAGAGLAACISCHSAGPAPFTDAMRGHIESEKFTAPKDVRDAALAVYPAAGLATQREHDSSAFRRAMIQAGIDPDRTIHGLEITSALARRYRLDLDARAIAAEAGLRVETLAGAVAADKTIDPSLAHRLRQGVVSRAEANTVLAAIRGLRPESVTGDRPSQPPKVTLAPSPSQPRAEPDTEAPLRLLLWTERSRYASGELVAFHAAASAPCHLTLIGIDPAGKATVLFPSEFEPDNLLQPHRPVTVPAAGAQYQFRLRERGLETIIGVCQVGVKFPLGIEPDYERQRFTVLGSYENFERSGFQSDAPAPRTRGGRNGSAKTDAAQGAVARAAIRIAIE